MKQFFIFLFAIISLQNIFAGGTVVGDGGYVVACKNTWQFLDIFEGNFYRPFAVPFEYNPGNFDIHDGQKEIHKIASIYQLEPRQIEILSSVSKAFFYRQFDPWQSPGGFDFVIPSLAAQPVLLLKSAADDMKKNKCNIYPIAIKVKQDGDSDAEVVCGNFYFGKKHCLLVDQRSFHKLSFVDQKCLFVHEMLRYTPAFNSIDPSKEINLRKTTLNLCLDQ